MGAGGASTGGGGGVGPAGIKTDGTYGTKKDAKQASKRNEFRVSGARDIDNLKLPGATNLLKGPLKAGSKITRDFFTNKVLTSKRGYKGLNKRQFESLSIAEQNKIYSGYMDDRLSNKTDAYGNPTPRDRDIEKPTKILQATKLPIPETDAPSDEKNAAGILPVEKSGDDTEEKYDARKTKRRGRRRTILTSQRGASGNLVLGKPTLLGA
jgi:hypothetical protein